MYSEGWRSAKSTRVSWAQVTFGLPDVSLLHPVSSEAGSSYSVVNTRRLLHVNVVGIILDADRKVIQVWSGTCQSDWTVKTLEVWLISGYFLMIMEDGSYLRYWFVLHIKTTKTFETKVEHRRDVHGFRYRDSITCEPGHHRKERARSPPLTSVHGFSLDSSSPATTILSTRDLEKLCGDLDIILRILDLLDASLTRVILGPSVAV